MLRETHQCGESDLPRGDISSACRAGTAQKGHRSSVYCIVCAHVDASSGWLADGGRVRTLKSAVERRWGALERAGAGPRRCVCCIYHVCTIKCAGHTARRSSRHSLKT